MQTGLWRCRIAVEGVVAQWGEVCYVGPIGPRGVMNDDKYNIYRQLRFGPNGWTEPGPNPHPPSFGPPPTHDLQSGPLPAHGGHPPMSDQHPTPTQTQEIAEGQSSAPSCQAEQPDFDLDLVDRLGVAALAGDHLTAPTVQLAQKLMRDAGRGHALRAVLAAELAVARSRLRVREHLLDSLITKSLKSGTPSRNVSILSSLVKTDARRLQVAIDLFSRLAMGCTPVQLRAHQAVVFAGSGER